MAGPVALIGRSAELQALQQHLALTDAGQPGVVLVHGEAGIGKSRLLRAALEEAQGRGYLVALGHCTPVIGPELPFGAFVEMLSRLAGDGVDLAAAIEPAWVGLDYILGGPAPLPVAAEDTGLARSRFFAGVLGLFRHLAAERPVVLAVEDIHWADPSSADLLVFLARSLRHQRLLLLLTCRDEAVARGSPIRAVLSEISRIEGARRLSLEPLPDDDMDVLLQAAQRRAMVAPERRTEIISVSDGNAFFALELLADESGGGRSGGSGLRDVVLAPLDSLPDASRRLLEVAAVFGDAVESELLRAAVDLPAAAFGETVRRVLDPGLLVLTEGEYRFRHALVRESIVAEMLPAELREAHLAVVHGLLAAGADVQPMRAVQLAHHLVASGECVPEALRAVVRAARHAAEIYAFPEAHAQYAVALKLWGRVPDAESVTDTSYVDLLCERALAARWCGACGDATTELQRALEGRPLERLQNARAEHALGQLRWATGDTAGSVAAYERADALLTESDEPLLRARVAAALGTGLVLMSRDDRAASVLDTALALASAAGAHRERLQARISGALLLARRGDLAGAVTELRTCLDIARRHRAPEAVVRCYGNLVFLHVTAGRLRDALDAAAEGAQACAAYGPLVSVAPTLVENWVAALVDAGRWDEAHLVASTDAPDGVGLTLHFDLARVAVARGDDDALEQHLRAVADLRTTDDPYALHDEIVVRVEHLLWQQDPEAARKLARRALTDLELQHDDGLTLSVGALALRAIADCGGATIGSAAETAAEAAEVLRTLDRRLRAADAAYPAALALLCAAEAARGRRADAPEQWEAVALAWLQLERPYPAAYARLRQAERLFARQARGAGSTALRAALDTATELGCRPLGDALNRLAVLAGVRPDELTAPPRPPAARPVSEPLSVLTRRERQVLGLLVDGLTNQQIARRLFIADNTVGVHVSNILGKLGVSNRVEAATLALRAHLLPGPSAPGPSAPGPSTPGPSTPGPSTPGPSTPSAHR